MKSFRPPHTTTGNTATGSTTNTPGSPPSPPLSSSPLHHRRLLVRNVRPAVTPPPPILRRKYDPPHCPTNPPSFKVLVVVVVVVISCGVVWWLLLAALVVPWPQQQQPPTGKMIPPPPQTSDIRIHSNHHHHHDNIQSNGSISIETTETTTTTGRLIPLPPTAVLLHLPIQPYNQESIRTAFDENVHWMQQQVERRYHQNHNGTSRYHSAITLHYHGVEELAVLSRPWFTWNGNAFCSTIQQERTKHHQQQQQHDEPFIIVNITLSCRDVFENGHVGTGNYLAFFYGLRLSAHVLGNIDLYLTCDDAVATQRELILPWIMGYFPARDSQEPSRYPHVSTKSACSDFRYLPLIYMVPEIQQDLRRMAIALVGIPSTPWSSSTSEELPRHPSDAYAQQYLWPFQTTKTDSHSHSPGDGNDDDRYYYHRLVGSSVLLLPPPKEHDEPMYSTPSEFQMDDVTIHFRCGDFMSDQWHHIETSTFQAYVDPILTITGSVRSIGILTQSLEIHNSTTDGGPLQQQRIDDLEQTVVGRCRILVHSFVAYLQHRHPHVEIHIHNGPQETIALTYARMILARQSITGMTSFGELATTATFGTGYIRSPGQWIRTPMEEDAVVPNGTNLVWYPSQKIVSFHYIKQLWTANGTPAVLQWFWNGIIPPDGNYCGMLHRDDTCL